MTVPLLALTEEVGPPDAPLLVLGPSLGTSTILWDDAIPFLRERYRVTCWDLPGHGHSPATRDPFTMAELAQALLTAIDRPAFLIAGVSLGGAVSLEVALAAPERVLAASMICSAAKFGTAEGWRERAAIARSQGTASLVIQSATRWFAPGSIERRPQLTGRLLHALRDADDESYALCADALAGYDDRSRLAEVEVPMLAIWGEHDAVATASDAAAIAEGVRNGRAVRIADAAHLAPAEQPVAVASALIDFFQNGGT